MHVKKKLNEIPIRLVPTLLFCLRALCAIKSDTVQVQIIVCKKTLVKKSGIIDVRF